jgi:predicted ATPase/transcriptional regulator with XRE-family HTH domain
VSETGKIRNTPSLAELLRRHMDESGLKQRQLAAKAGVPGATLSRWLSGQSVNPYHRAGMLCVAAALGLRKVSANRLLRAAGLPSIEALSTTADPEELELLKPWLFPARNNLPASLTSFVGRTEEIDWVSELLYQDDVRLVTLTGTGGSGKTRLARRVAENLLDAFPDGVFFVQLAPITAPHLVIQAIAEAIDLRDVLDSALRNRLVGWLRSRRVLLLVDNLEHLLESGADLTGLLRAAPCLKILATSRIALHVFGEHEWPVEPLPLPNPDQPRRILIANPAIDLFIQRGRAARPRYVLDDEDLPIMAQLCARLDGLPLAIELAAARMRDLSPVQLLENFPSRLDLASIGPRDVPRRQQTLRETIDWSVQLLPEHARAILLRLAVFAGGWTEEAARNVCFPDGFPAGGIEQTLRLLLDASLIERVASPNGTPRYRMLETIREYGIERRAEVGDETTLRKRHARHFLILAESAPPYVPEARTSDWYERVDADLDNLRAALDWANGQDDLALVARFAAALWPYWHEYLHVNEGRRWVEAVLAPGRQHSPARRAWLLTGASTLLSTQSIHQEVSKYAHEALALWRQLDNPRGQALVLRQLGWRNYMLETGDRAIEWLSGALEQWRIVGDPQGIACALGDLGLASCALGDLAAAAPYFAEADEYYRGTDDKLGPARLLRDRGLHALLCGDVDAAIPLLGGAVDRLRNASPNYVLPGAVFYLGTALCFRGRLDDATATYIESLRIHEELADMPGMALTLLGFATVAHRQGNGIRAAILCGAEQAMRHSSHLAVPPAVAAIYAREIERIREQLDEAAFNQAVAQGNEMNLAEALAFARQGVSAV